MPQLGAAVYGGCPGRQTTYRAELYGLILGMREVHEADLQLGGFVVVRFDNEPVVVSAQKQLADLIDSDSLDLWVHFSQRRRGCAGRCAWNGSEGTPTPAHCA